MRQVHNRKIFCADLETTINKALEWTKYKQTRAYACSIAPVSVMFDTNEHGHSMKYGAGLKSRYALKHFGLLEDFFDYLNKPKTWGDNIVVFFHNGQHFDFGFLISGLQDHPANYHQTFNEQALSYKRLQGLFYGVNFGEYSKTDGGLSLRVGLGNEKADKHVAIEFLDSRKLNPRSIEKGDKDLIHKTFIDDFMSDPGSEFGHIDLHKDHTIQFDYVQYIDGETAYCKDGTTYNLRDSKTGPKMIIDRVGNDVLIMCFAIKYMLIHGLINLPTSNKIYPTISTVSIARYVNLKLSDSVLRAMVSDDERVDNEKLWTTIYGSSLESRVQQRVKFDKGISGGLTTFHPCAYNKEVKGRYLSLDINSLYPGNSTFPLPYGEPVKLDKVDLNPNTICFVHIKFDGLKQKNMRITPNIPKWGEEGYKVEDHVKMQHYAYDIRKGEAGLITNADYETFLNPNYFEFKKMEVVEVGGFQTAHYLKDFMEYGTKIKQESKSASERLLAKTIMNAFTGKLTQRADRYETVNPKYGAEHNLTKEDMIKKYCSEKNPYSEFNEFVIDTSWTAGVNTGHDILVKTYSPASFSFPCAYAYITARGRGYIVKKMNDITYEGPSLINVYTDTDSMKLLCTSEEDYPQILKWLADNQGLDDKELGKFKEEDNGEVYGMKVLAAKKYVATDKEGFIIPSKSGLSGINFKDLVDKYGTDKITADKLNPGDTIATKRTRHVKGGVLIEDTNLILSDIQTEETHE